MQLNSTGLPVGKMSFTGIGRPIMTGDMNMPIRGYNETLIVYILAASSASHGIAASVYHNGYARNGGIVNGKSFYGYKLPLGEDYGGPLFFTHYSFLGLDPRNLRGYLCQLLGTKCESYPD